LDERPIVLLDIGPFALLAAALPSIREIPLAAPASTATGLVWDGKRGRSTSDAPELIFDLSRPMRIAGVRERYSDVNPSGWLPMFGVDWRKAGAEKHGTQWKSYEHWHLKADGREVTVPVWMDDTVDRIRIRPDKRPCDFTLSDIVLLVSVPATDPQTEDEAGTSKLAARALAGPQGARAALR
jgi:hypothetical protein